MNKLPREIQKEIKSTKRIVSSGFSEIIGENGRTMIWSAGGNWISNDKFEVNSFGSDNYQWTKAKGLWKT